MSLRTSSSILSSHLRNNLRKLTLQGNQMNRSSCQTSRMHLRDHHGTEEVLKDSMIPYSARLNLQSTRWTRRSTGLFCPRQECSTFQMRGSSSFSGKFSFSFNSNSIGSWMDFVAGTKRRATTWWLTVSRNSSRDGARTSSRDWLTTWELASKESLSTLRMLSVSSTKNSQRLGTSTCKTMRQQPATLLTSSRQSSTRNS